MTGKLHQVIVRMETAKLTCDNGAELRFGERHIRP
jgi:hypothetical protein